jgi:hypothetical protein
MLKRINRREAIAAGISGSLLTLAPELRGQMTQPDAWHLQPAMMAQEALRQMEQHLPKLDRAFAGYGNDGERVEIGDQDYELVLAYWNFTCDRDILFQDLVAGHLEPAGCYFAELFLKQKDLKHLVTRRLEPVNKLGVVGAFAFHDNMGLRATLGHTVERLICSVEILAGVQRDLVRKMF